MAKKVKRPAKTRKAINKIAKNNINKEVKYSTPTFPELKEPIRIKQPEQKDLRKIHRGEKLKQIKKKLDEADLLLTRTKADLKKRFMKK